MNFMNADKDQPTKIYRYLHRRSLLKLICLSGAGFLIGACDLRSADSRQDIETRRNNKMEAAIATSNIPRPIPPMDVMQPRGIKTATFALG
jgi:hypothetical protein